MSDLPQNSKNDYGTSNPDNPQIPKAVIDLVVSDLFKRNGINPDKVKKNLSEEQKQAIKELVNDLTQQVNKFVNPPDSKNNKKSK